MKRGIYGCDLMFGRHNVRDLPWEMDYSPSGRCEKSGATLSPFAGSFRLEPHRWFSFSSSYESQAQKKPRCLTRLFRIEFDGGGRWIIPLRAVAKKTSQRCLHSQVHSGSNHIGGSHPPPIINRRHKKAPLLNEAVSYQIRWWWEVDSNHRSSRVRFTV